MEKLKVLSREISPAANVGSPDDVVICCALRTPLTKAKKGGFKNSTPEELLSALFKEVLRRTNLEPSLIEDVCIGNVLQPGAGVLTSRVAELLGGLPYSTTISAVNRQCSSGLQAVAFMAGAIKAGHVSVALAGGVESMTFYDMASLLDIEKVSQDIFQTDIARRCLLPMGITSERVAQRFGITREEQDEFAVESHKKAFQAQVQGLFDEEVVPVIAKVQDDSGTFHERLVSKDDGIRSDANIVALSKLRPAFEANGTTTAGNSSQVTDGAALVLLASREAALKYHLPILGRFVAYACVGVDPEIMGVGPAYAIPKVLEKAGLMMNDISLFELNEAFASQAVYCSKKLGIPKEKLNPKGGAIALGHPLGCTGARQIATLLPELRRRRSRYGIVSIYFIGILDVDGDTAAQSESSVLPA